MTSLPEAWALCLGDWMQNALSIICNFSFRGGERKQRVRGDGEAAMEKSDTVWNRNQSESFQAWAHIQPYVASAHFCSVYEKSHVLPLLTKHVIRHLVTERGIKRKRNCLFFFPERSDLGCVLYQPLFFRLLRFQGFSVTSIRQCGICCFFVKLNGSLVQQHLEQSRAHSVWLFFSTNHP